MYYHRSFVVRVQHVGYLFVREPPQLLVVHASALALMEEVLFGPPLLLGLLQPADNDVGDGPVDGDDPRLRLSEEPSSRKDPAADNKKLREPQPQRCGGVVATK